MSKGHDDLATLPYDTDQPHASDKHIIDLVLPPVASKQSDHWKFWMVLAVAYVLTSLPIFEHYARQLVGRFFEDEKSFQSRFAVLAVRVGVFLLLFYLSDMYVL